MEAKILGEEETKVEGCFTWNWKAIVNHAAISFVSYEPVGKTVQTILQAFVDKLCKR